LEELAWLFDGIQNSAFDGLEFMLSTKSLDSASVKKLRAEMAKIRKDAKVDLLEVSSPVLGAMIFLESHHFLIKNFTQRVIENLEFVSQSFNSREIQAGQTPIFKNKILYDSKVHLIQAKCWSSVFLKDNQKYN